MRFERQFRETAPAFVPVLSRQWGSWKISVDRRAFAVTELEGHYDRKAGTWQTIIDRHGFEAAYEHLIRTVLACPTYRQQARPLQVLDAGIGTGAMSLAFQAIWDHGCSITGIDISRDMLKEARTRMTDHGLDPCLQKADVTDLPFPDASFDVVLAAHVFEHLANPETALAEAFRVLKPGGILICSITRRSRTGAFIQFVWRTHQVRWRHALGWLRQVGFGAVRAFPFAKGSAARRFSIGYVGRKPE